MPEYCLGVTEHGEGPDYDDNDDDDDGLARSASDIGDPRMIVSSNCVTPQTRGLSTAWAKNSAHFIKNNNSISWTHCKHSAKTPSTGGPQHNCFRSCSWDRLKIADTTVVEYPVEGGRATRVAKRRRQPVQMRAILPPYVSVHSLSRAAKNFRKAPSSTERGSARFDQSRDNLRRRQQQQNRRPCGGEDEGLPYMMSAKFPDFLTPSPSLFILKYADFVPFVCFLGTLLPAASVDVLNGSPTDGSMIRGGCRAWSRGAS